MKLTALLAAFAAIILVSAAFSTEASAQYQPRLDQGQFQGRGFQGTSTPVNGTTYINNNFGVKVSIPSGWSGVEMKRTSGPTTVTLTPNGFQFGQGAQRPPVTISLSMIPKNNSGPNGQHFNQRGFDQQACSNSTNVKTINNLNFNEMIIECNGDFTMKSQNDRIQTDSNIISLSLRADSGTDFNSQSGTFQTMLGTLQITSPSSSSASSQNTVIPTWVKKNAGYWSSGTVGDSDFVSGIQYLVQHGVMKIPHTDNSASTNSSSQIPTWIKKNAGWWSEGQLSDDDFVKGMQYLISSQIIKIS